MKKPFIAVKIDFNAMSLGGERTLGKMPGGPAIAELVRDYVLNPPDIKKKPLFGADPTIILPPK